MAISRVILAFLLTLPLFSVSDAQSSPLEAGAAAVDITPQFEGRPVDPKSPYYLPGRPFFDTGVDGRYDFEEPGALGPDGKPGIAGFDDDGDGLVDNCDRSKCQEYLAEDSDDVADPNRDNYHKKRNPKGTQGDGKYQFLHIAGFRPYYPSFLPNRLAAGVHDPIWARALALRGSNGVATVLISTDLPGLAWKYINPVRRRLERDFGISAANIIIASTHNHAGPDASGYWSTILKGHNHAYATRLMEWMYEAGAQAIRSLQPARMRTITTTHYSCYDPRTKRLKKDPECRIPPNNGDYEGRSAGDYDVRIVQTDIRDPIVRNTRIVASQFVSARGGETIATFINWHNHPDSLMGKNMLISSDFVHYLREFVERKLGGTAVYFSGTVGCQIGAHAGVPAPLWSESMERVADPETGGPVLVTDGWERIRSIGYEVAHEVVAALAATSEAEAEVPISVRTEPLDTRVDNFLHVMATSSVWEKHVEAPDAMRHYKGHCGNRLGCVRSDVSVLTIGELGVVTGPGEIDPGYFLGRPASRAHYGFFHGTKKYPAMPAIDPYVPGKHHAVLGEANNYLSYLVHQPDNHGWWNFSHPMNYEEFVTTSKTFGDEWGNKIMEMLGAPERFSKDQPYPKASSLAEEAPPAHASVNSVAGSLFDQEPLWNRWVLHALDRMTPPAGRLEK